MTKKPSVPATPLTKSMSLTVVERFVLPSLLPRKGSLFKLNMAKNIEKRVEVPEEEYDLYGIKVSGRGRVTWNVEKAQAQKTIKFQMAEIELIKENIKQLDKEEELNVENMGLAERFLDIDEK